MAAETPMACAEAFTAALIRRDLGSAQALLSDDVVFFYTNGSAILGKDEFAKTMTASWTLVQDYTYSTLDSLWLPPSDDAAVVIYTFAWSGRVAEQAVQGGGRGTRVFSKASDGWLIAHEHLSAGRFRSA